MGIGTLRRHREQVAEAKALKAPMVEVVVAVSKPEPKPQAAPEVADLALSAEKLINLEVGVQTAEIERTRGRPKLKFVPAPETSK